MLQTFINFLFINAQITIISQCESKLVSFTLAQLLHKGNVYVSDAAALHTLEGPDARELGTVLVKVLFKIVVDPSLHIACEALLSFGVAVTEIVTVATGDEVETVGLIGRPGAIVRGPVTARRTLGVARVSKLTAVGEAAGAVRCLERRRCCRFDSLVCYQLGGDCPRAYV